MHLPLQSRFKAFCGSIHWVKAQQECIFIFGYFVCLRLYFPVNNYSAMSAKWRLTVHPILGYQGEKGGGGANVLPLFFWRGQISTIMHLLRGQLSSPVNCLGGRCPHMPFFIGGQMSGGENVRLPSGYNLKKYCILLSEDLFYLYK